MKMKQVDYIRNCVQERIGYLHDKAYSSAYNRSYRDSQTETMQGRIDAIVKAHIANGRDRLRDNSI